jgi:hypothetical protein
MKGDTIKWSDPSIKGYLINPVYIKGFAASEIKHKKLVEDGYIYFADAAEKLGIDKRKLSYLTSKIAPDKSYSPDGQPATSNTVGAVKGDYLRWAHPYDTHVVLFHPDFVEELRRRLQNEELAASTEKGLLEKGYYTIESAI